jgi:hypothetical protein
MRLRQYRTVGKIVSDPAYLDSKAFTARIEKQAKENELP